MRVQFHPDFDRHFAGRLTPLQRNQVVDVIYLFSETPFHKNLRNHILYGEWKGYRSISVGGDLRLHYREYKPDIALFVAVGTHAQLYK
jgi:addiction module RelE/StbE family toxin